MRLSRASPPFSAHGPDHSRLPLRDREPDVGSCAVTVDGVRRASVRLRDHLRDRKPESGSAVGACLVGTGEALEGTREELVRESWALVDNVKLDGAVALG